MAKDLRAKPHSAGPHPPVKPRFPIELGVHGIEYREVEEREKQHVIMCPICQGLHQSLSFLSRRSQCRLNLFLKATGAGITHEGYGSEAIQVVGDLATEVQGLAGYSTSFEYVARGALEDV
jgi:hypothetical protein